MASPYISPGCALIHIDECRLFAIMLGRLRMSTQEALTKYNEIAERVFGPSNTKWRYQEGTFKASTLELEIKKLVAEYSESGDGGERMLDVSAVHTTGLAYVDFITMVGSLELIDTG